jgi:hypothetical protein
MAVKLLALWFTLFVYTGSGNSNGDQEDSETAEEAFETRGYQAAFKITVGVGRR